MHAQERWREAESSPPETSHLMEQRCVFACSFLHSAVSRCWPSPVRRRRGTICGAPSDPGSPATRCSWPGRGADRRSSCIPHKVYVIYGTLSSIYIISSTIYTKQNIFFYRECALQGALYSSISLWGYTTTAISSENLI